MKGTDFDANETGNNHIIPVEERDIPEVPTEQGSPHDTPLQYQNAAIENAHVRMVVLDPDGTIRVWNRAAAKISGRDEKRCNDRN